ncbi:putative transcription factor interactor and regulator CCHC(Zn) family [Helianthus anomalus]
MSSQNDVIKRHLEAFRYLPDEFVEALTDRFAELLTDMKKAEIMVPSHMSNKRLLDVLKRIPDQPNCSWFRNVNQIILTTDCYCYKMKPDELISLIKSYDNADKQFTQGNTTDAVYSPTLTSTAPFPAAVCSSTSDAGIQIHNFTPIPTEVCVDEMCCTPKCREKVKGFKEQADSLVMQLQYTRSNNYEIKKKLNGYKDMVEVQKLDIRKLHSDLSEANCRYLHFKELSEKLTIELENLKSTFENKEFNFRKFDVSSEKVENMINQQLKYSKKELGNKGLGFVCIPPPYNHNYTSLPMTKGDIDNLPEMEYGKPEDRKDEPVKPKKVKFTRLDKTEIILEKQAFDKTFVKPAEVSNHTETLNFEKNVDVDKHNQVLDNTESTISQKPSELQNKREESQIKPTNLQFTMLNEFFEWSRKQTDSTAPSDSSCDSTETANCEKSELGDDIVCQKADDVCSKKSNLSPDASPYVRKVVFEPALRGPSNKYVPPKPTIRNENAKSSKCDKCCKHKQMKQGRKVEQTANKSSNKCYNSYSASVGSNESGYAPHVKKQTCYNCGIPGHIARNCTHRPYVPYYTQHQKVTSRDRSYSKPMKFEKPTAMMNKHPQVKPSDGDWNAAKTKRKQALKPKQVLKNKKVEKQTVLPKAPNKLEKPKQVWREKHKAATSPVLESKGGMCFREVSYIDASGIPRTAMAWVPMSY